MVLLWLLGLKASRYPAPELLGSGHKAQWPLQGLPWATFFFLASDALSSRPEMAGLGQPHPLLTFSAFCSPFHSSHSSHTGLPGIPASYQLIKLLLTPSLFCA